MDWYVKVLQQYADFSGRARRREYWMFYLVSTVISFMLLVIDFGLLGAADSGFPFLSFLYGLLMIIPTFSVGVRRLHDTNRSGWWFLITLLPILGGFIFLIFLVQDGTPRANRWGPSPKRR